MIRNAPPLGPFVETLWLRDGYMPMIPSEFVLPTGTVEIVIDLCDGILRVSDSTSPLQFESFHGAVVCGIHSKPFVIDTSQTANLLGVHFAPGGAFPFLGVPLDELRNHRVSLSDLWGKVGDAFLERALAATSRSKSVQAVGAKKSVQALLEDIRLMSEQNYEIVESVRALVRKTFETSSEEVKYVGILFM